MTIHRLVLKRRASLLVALGLGLVVTLSGCNFQRQTGGGTSSGSGPSAGGAVAAPTVAGPEATSAAPETTAETTAAAIEATSAAPTGGTTVSPTTETDALGNEIDHDLQQLDDLNATADPLDDQP